MDNDQSTYGNSIAQNVALLLGVTVTLVLLAEVGVRALLWWRTPHGMRFDPAIIYTYDPRTDVGFTRLNDIGCIGDDVLPEKLPDERRVFLLGGSTSFSQRYVDAVREELAGRYPRISMKVVSCGKPRYTSAVNLANLRKYLISHQPDVVVTYMGINDNIYNAFLNAALIPSVGFFNWKSLRSSVSWDMFWYHVFEKRLLSRPDFGGETLRSEVVFRDSLNGIIETAESAGAKVVVSTFAISYPTEDPAMRAAIERNAAVMQHFWGTAESTALGVGRHNAISRKLAAERGLPLADVAADLPRDSRHFVDICHFSAIGEMLLGRTVAEKIVLADR